MKLTRLATGSVQGFGKIKSSQVFPGAYFWSTSSDNNLNQWWNLKSWWVDGAQARAASKLPKSDTDVVIVAGSVAPYLNLDRQGLVQPRSINASTIGLTAYSGVGAPVTCSITTVPPMAATFDGNATYNF